MAHVFPANQKAHPALGFTHLLLGKQPRSRREGFEASAAKVVASSTTNPPVRTMAHPPSPVRCRSVHH
eukprot:scaffold873_cov393-Prasinococcus_capsulatus_cf.AAC.4